ncbi:RluA family pseudouridine synthase [Sporolactobacillus vineae]|uniref:RluA family pseudouridine synthase n=1 Tax=Sporolactobacillus vineae TaxID=444463 RepID=UPI0004749339|nr:RluA family pseudouridine synthase [Sporolactobacillus vineae]
MGQVTRTADLPDEGKRADKWASDLFPDESRSRLQQLIKNGEFQINGKKIRPSYRVQTGDKATLVLPAPEPAAVVPEAIPLDIVYEDHDVLVVNKPRGMVVHPSPGHMSGTLVNALLHHCTDLSGINGVLRPGIVHRIDKDTSGLLMVAKTDSAHRSLAAQLKDKSTKRQYLAIVHGVIAENEGIIDAPIGRDARDRKKMAVTADHSKQAVTHFKVLERFPRYTLVACRLETGRTHQIRVHMAYIGHPLAGDPKYGPRKTLPIDGQALHAAEIGFTHPVSGKFMAFRVNPPADFQGLLDRLRHGGFS